MSSTQQYEVIIVGGGIIGLSAAYQLTKLNIRVLLLEQFSLPHTRGSSSGGSRLICKYSYPNTDYTNLVSSAYNEWKKIERLSGIELLRETGLIQIEDTSPGRNEHAIKEMDKDHVKYEILKGNELNKIHKNFQYDKTHTVLYEKTTGVLKANKCIQALCMLIKRQGGDIVEDFKVSYIKPGIVVTIGNNDKQFQSNSVILAPGPWATELLAKIKVDLPIKTMPGFQYFWKIRSKEGYSAKNRFPVIKHWIQKQKGYQFVYAIPEWEYPGIMKVGTRFEPHNQYISPDNRDYINPDDVRTTLMEYIRKHLTFLDPSPSILEPCMYSVTEDKNYIVDTVTDHNNIVIAAGMSGHGFHSAPAIGEILRDLSLKRTPSYNISAYSLKRFNQIKAKM